MLRILAVIRAAQEDEDAVPQREQLEVVVRRRKRPPELEETSETRALAQDLVHLPPAAIAHHPLVHAHHSKSKGGECARGAPRQDTLPALRLHLPPSFGVGEQGAAMDQVAVRAVRDVRQTAPPAAPHLQPSRGRRNGCAGAAPLDAASEQLGHPSIAAVVLHQRVPAAECPHSRVVEVNDLVRGAQPARGVATESEVHDGARGREGCSGAPDDEHAVLLLLGG